jgi:hypothetical protein
MQCYRCGAIIAGENRLCPACGRPRSRLIYVPLWGVIGGVVGSLVGFTAWQMAGPLLGGILGIVACEVAARLMLRGWQKG